MDMDQLTEKTKNAAQKTGDKAKDMAQNVSDKTKNAAENLSDKTQSIKDKVTDRVQNFAEGRDEVSDHSEGPVARAIEYYTARLPSDTYLWAAFGSIGTAMFFKARGRDGVANFIGQWAPTFLILGLYNKLVKVAGSDRLDQKRPLFEGREAKPALH